MKVKRTLMYLKPETLGQGGYVLGLHECEVEPGWVPFAIQETRLRDGRHLSSPDPEYREGYLAVFVWLRSEDA